MINNLLNQFFQQQSWLYRGLAIFFLLFMLFDIAFPENCAEESFISADNNTEVGFHLNSQSYKESHLAFVESKVESSITVDCSHHTHQNPSRQSDDDCCFCCCSHWLPAKNLKIEGTFTDLSLQNSINLDFLPEAPSQKTFHPPKHS